MDYFVNYKDDNMIPEPISAEQALEILSNFFLGDNFCIAESVSPGQANVYITHYIMNQFPRKYEKFIKENGWDETDKEKIPDVSDFNKSNKYRKKPVTIEAIQFTRNNIKAVADFTSNAAHSFSIIPNIHGKYTCTIDTLEGKMTATEDDFIIRGVDGEYYACKPDIFKKTYEKVNEVENEEIY